MRARDESGRCEGWSVPYAPRPRAGWVRDALVWSRRPLLSPACTTSAAAASAAAPSAAAASAAAFSASSSAASSAAASAASFASVFLPPYLPRPPPPSPVFASSLPGFAQIHSSILTKDASQDDVLTILEHELARIRC